MRVTQLFFSVILFFSCSAIGTEFINFADCGDFIVSGKYQKNPPANKEFTAVITIENTKSKISIALRDNNNYIIHCGNENHSQALILQEVDFYRNKSQYYLYDRVSLQIIPFNELSGNYQWSYIDVSKLHTDITEGIGNCVFGKNKQKFVRYGHHYCVQAE